MNAIIKWWVTPKLPPEDIFDFPLLQDKSIFGKGLHLISHWLIHPFKRRLARWYLKLLQSYTKITVIGVTGSAGKSTTVQMTASILRQKGKTVATPPSIDPIFNVPNTILKCPPWTKYLILEMSVEYPGEMDFYLWLAKPDIGVITNIFPTHTEFLKNEEGVLKEKSKLVIDLDKSSFAVLNKDDKRLRNLAKKIRAGIIWFKTENAAAASSVGKLLGASQDGIVYGLKNYNRPKHRLEIKKHKSGAVILDDSYNSNPQAAILTVNYFNKLAKGEKIAVLGDMLELGDYEEEGHRKLGEVVAKSNFAVVIGVGEASKYLIDEINKDNEATRTYLVSAKDEVFPILEPLLSKKTYVLIKGSRSIGLDEVVSRLS